MVAGGGPSLTSSSSSLSLSRPRRAPAPAASTKPPSRRRFQIGHKRGLICSACDATVAFGDELLRDRVPCDALRCFAYELDLCGREDMACYSATNESDDRFDLVLVSTDDRRFRTNEKSRKSGETFLGGRRSGNPPVKPPQDSVLVALDVTAAESSGPSAAHTWFPPYAWRPAACANCATLLGWTYHDDPRSGAHKGAEEEEEEEKDPAFVGLICTRLREAIVSRDSRSREPSIVERSLTTLRRSRDRVLGAIFASKANRRRINNADQPPPENMRTILSQAPFSEATTSDAGFETGDPDAYFDVFRSDVSVDNSVVDSVISHDSETIESEDPFTSYYY